MSAIEPCPGCGSHDVDPAGHAITIVLPADVVPAGASHTGRGPKCRTCGFWSCRGDWTAEQNLAAWQAWPRLRVGA